MIETIRSAEVVDVIILAEGTYPYVRGGVASWICDMVVHLPQYRFGIIFLGAFPGMYKEFVYEVPDNVVSLQILYLFTNEEQLPKESLKVQAPEFEDIKALHTVFKKSHGCPKGMDGQLSDMGLLMEPEKGFNYFQFLHSKDAWDFTVEQYLAHSTDPSFMNYFWNIRNMHAPLWNLEAMLKAAPKTKIIHSISTGYAGFLAVLLHQRFQAPLILSEHGIYTKERNIELLQSTLIVSLDMLSADRTLFSYQHELWLRFFDSLARACYEYAYPIVSLFQGAQKQQQYNGADESKTRVIPNGVDIAKFAAARRPLSEPVPKIICFVGRFVRIKDIKTFIRAVGILFDKDPEVVAWIRPVGESDEEYLQECMDYIQLMGLEKRITFLEEGNMLSILEGIGLLILSSISEGMPLVLLECLAAGIPAITTDVGACKEIIEGVTDEDKALGPCGAIVGISDATTMANQMLRFITDETVWRAASDAGIARVTQYYNQNTMIETYDTLYKEVVQWPA